MKKIIFSIIVGTFLAVSAFATNGTIRIIKDAQPNHTQDFTFTTTGGNSIASSFILDDDGNNFNTRSNLYSVSTHLGTYTVTESTAGSWYLGSIVCTENGTQDTTSSIVTRKATIKLQVNETVTCTFRNLLSSAAEVTVSGRVLTDYGQGIRNARVSAVDAVTGLMKSAYTNTFGYYTLSGLDAGSMYVFDVDAKSYTFDSRMLGLTSNISDFNFIPVPEVVEPPNGKIATKSEN